MCLTSSTSRTPGVPAPYRSRRYLPPQRGQLVEYYDAWRHRAGVLDGQQPRLGRYRRGGDLFPDAAVSAHAAALRRRRAAHAAQRPVAFNKLRQFSLAPYRADFPRPQAHPDWQTLELRDVTFHYPDQRFAVGPLNLTLKRGELVFLIGGNGSGKSTLAMLLTGLYQPISGQILVDGQPLAAERPEEYRKLFSAVFTDVWLFDRLLGPQGEEADPALVATWLERLQMAHKLQLENGKIADLRLSKGQKKRVALLLALAESRDIILLDEWAADQDPHFRREFYQSCCR